MASAATQSTYRSFPSSLFLLRWDSFHNFTRLPFSLPSLPRSPLPLQNMQIPPERGRVIWSRPFVGRLPPALPLSRPAAIRSLFGAANWNSFSSSAVLEPPPSLLLLLPSAAFWCPCSRPSSVGPVVLVPVPVSPFCVLCSQPCSKYGWDLPPRLPALPLPLLVICKVDGSIL